MMRALPTSEPLHQALYLLSQSWLVEDLLMKADKMTMAASLELRVPFLAHPLVEWAARAPASAKVGRDASGRYVTKKVLREFASTRLPADIVSRRKQGFPVPVYGWLADKLRPWARDLLAPGAMVFRYLHAGAIERHLTEGTRANASMLHRHRLWNLLILELWLREWQPA
jgi:asparagine synthase (glutamine-hydrolysing)